jgi:hypothetical protein
MSLLLAGATAFVGPLRAQSTARHPVLTLADYVKQDGAITVYAHGSYVEPYFAMRALNTAADLGANVDSLARGYVAWQLARLDADSSFRRECQRPDGGWSACGAADADDAALGLWIELLYRAAGTREMPAAWSRSVGQSRRELASLLDSASQVYAVSKSVRAALLMDNVEVLSALDVSGRTDAAASRGDRRSLQRGAARLRTAIPRVFWNRTARRYRVSTQGGGDASRFYPEVVAQVFPAAFGYGNPAQSSKALVGQWLEQHERDWIAQTDSGAAWGLVAVAALRAEQFRAADCWLARAEQARLGAGWNVVDEAIYVTLSAAKRLGPERSCPRVDSRPLRPRRR